MLIELKNGKRKEFKPALAKILIAKGIGKEAQVDLQYQTRMMTAQPVQYTRSEPVEAAPYGYKQDGTPRQRPGRAPKAE